MALVRVGQVSQRRPHVLKLVHGCLHTPGMIGAPRLESEDMFDTQRSQQAVTPDTASSNYLIINNTTAVRSTINNILPGTWYVLNTRHVLFNTINTTAVVSLLLILLLQQQVGSLTGAIVVLRFSTFVDRQRPHPAVCRSRLQLPPPQRGDLIGRLDRQARWHQSMAITAIHDWSGLGCSTRALAGATCEEALILVER